MLNLIIALLVIASLSTAFLAVVIIIRLKKHREADVKRADEIGGRRSKAGKKHKKEQSSTRQDKMSKRKRAPAPHLSVEEEEHASNSSSSDSLLVVGTGGSTRPQQDEDGDQEAIKAPEPTGPPQKKKNKKNKKKKEKKKEKKEKKEKVSEPLDVGDQEGAYAFGSEEREFQQPKKRPLKKETSPAAPSEATPPVRSEGAEGVNTKHVKLSASPRKGVQRHNDLGTAGVPKGKGRGAPPNPTLSGAAGGSDNKIQPAHVIQVPSPNNGDSDAAKDDSQDATMATTTSNSIQSNGKLATAKSRKGGTNKNGKSDIGVAPPISPQPQPAVPTKTMGGATRTGNQGEKSSESKLPAPTTTADELEKRDHAPSRDQPGSKQAPSRDQPGSKQAPSRGKPGGKQAPSRDQPGSKQAPSRDQPGGKQAPSRDQPGGKQAPSHDQPGSKQAPSHDQPGSKQAPSHDQPGSKQAPSHDQPGSKQAPSHDQPGGKEKGAAPTILRDGSREAEPCDPSAQTVRASLSSEGAESDTQAPPTRKPEGGVALEAPKEQRVRKGLRGNDRQQGSLPAQTGAGQVGGDAASAVGVAQPPNPGKPAGAVAIVQPSGSRRQATPGSREGGGQNVPAPGKRKEVAASHTATSQIDGERPSEKAGSSRVLRERTSTGAAVTANKKGKKSTEDFGYHFSEDRKLRSIEGNQPFKFVDQVHYEALGEAITEHVYKLLESEGGLNRMYFPSNASETTPRSFIFVSPDALTKDKVLILIHGSGVVRAGQWARRLIINDSLDSGTQLPYIARAKTEGYGVVVLNTNRNCDENGRRIEGSESPESHSAYVWKEFIRHAKATQIDIVAHSYGGVVTCSMVNRFRDDFERRVLRIAFTDSVHSVPSSLPSDNFIAKHAVNWVTSSEPLDTVLRYSSNDAKRVSAGTTVHEETSWKAIDSIFGYLRGKE